MPTRPARRGPGEVRSSLSSHPRRIRAHELDQLAGSRDRLGRGQRRVVEGEASEPRLDVALQQLGALLGGDGPDRSPPLLWDVLQQSFALALALDDEDACAKCQQHLRGIATDSGAVLLEDTLLALQFLEVAAEPVADVAMLRQDAEGLSLAASADQDLRAARLDRSRRVERVLDAVVLALEGWPLFGEHQLRDRQ